MNWFERIIARQIIKRLLKKMEANMKIMGGWKTWTGALGLIFTGLGLIFTDISNASTDHLAAGLLSIFGGLGMIGLGHKIEKLMAVLKQVGLLKMFFTPWILIPLIPLFIGCASIKPMVNKKYDFHMVTMYVHDIGGEDNSGAGLAVGPSVNVYWQCVNMVGLGSLGLAGISSLQDAGVNLTASPQFIPFSFFNDSIMAGAGRNFAARKYNYSFAVDLFALYRGTLGRKTIEPAEGCK